MIQHACPNTFFKPAFPNHSHANSPRLRDCEPRRKRQARSPATARISAKINCMTSNPSKIRERAFLEPRPHPSCYACILIPASSATVSGMHLLIYSLASLLSSELCPAHTDRVFRRILEI